MHSKFLNEELVRLMEKYKFSQADLVRRLDVRHGVISHIYTQRRTLGERLFLKILRQGFRLPEKEVEKIFTKAVKHKYLDDPDLK